MARFSCAVRKLRRRIGSGELALEVELVRAAMGLPQAGVERSVMAPRLGPDRAAGRARPGCSGLTTR
jgi:hypothetical protein